MIYFWVKHIFSIVPVALHFVYVRLPHKLQCASLSLPRGDLSYTWHKNLYLGANRVFVEQYFYHCASLYLQPSEQSIQWVLQSLRYLQRVRRRTNDNL